MNQNYHLAVLLLVEFGVCFSLSAQEQGFANQRDFFVDSNLVCEKGTELSKTFLKASEPEFARQLPDLFRWIARVEVRHRISDKGFASNHGSGVILADGQVLTARHVLEQNVEDGDKEKLKILLTMNDGRVFEATVQTRGELDWALLKISSPLQDSQTGSVPDSKQTVHSPIKLALPKPSATLVFMGYPARLGLDAAGKARSFNRGDPGKKIPVTRLDPCLVVGKGRSGSRELPGNLVLDPVAGFPPLGGMSGGPIFDLTGAVVGIQIGVTQTTADATGEVLVYRVDAVSTSAMKGVKPGVSTPK